MNGGLDWNGMVEWNGGMMVDKLDGFDELIPPFNDHL